MRRWDACDGNCYGMRRRDEDGDYMLYEDHVEALAAVVTAATAAERARCLDIVISIDDGSNSPSLETAARRIISGRPTPKEE